MAAIQGRDEIVVAAPLPTVWRLISDSDELVRWGPPVRSVEVFDRPERVGSRLRVVARFDGTDGHFVERRTEHVEQQKIAYEIEEETFGLFRVMSAPGFSLELDAIGPNETRVVFTFFHDPKGVLGHVLNVLVIRRKQRVNRLAALASLGRHAEAVRSGTT